MHQPVIANREMNIEYCYNGGWFNSEYAKTIMFCRFDVT
jgi:hypothetical protein